MKCGWVLMVMAIVVAGPCGKAIAQAPSVPALAYSAGVNTGKASGSVAYNPPASPLSGKEPKLNAKEKRGARLARIWIDKREMPEMVGAGKIVFAFGETLPSVLCTPLYVSDISLQPDEKVRNVNIGDSVRWVVSPAMSGPAGSETTHIIVKPREAGLATIMVVTTDRRAYHIKLVSSKRNWMPFVGFTYPEDEQAQWQAYYRQAAKKKLENTISGTGENVAGLDFNYCITGTAPWKPLRVYNDGVKTYIQMPCQMAQTEAPALLVIGYDKQKQMVNYRLYGDRYIVDQIFRKAVLIAGVGRSQTKITITREAK
jgi:P-type conjugative transfer protein TrbG